MTERINVIRDRIDGLLFTLRGKIHHKTLTKYRQELNEYYHSKKMLMRLETKIQNNIPKATERQSIAMNTRSSKSLLKNLTTLPAKPTRTQRRNRNEQEEVEAEQVIERNNREEEARDDYEAGHNEEQLEQHLDNLNDLEEIELIGEINQFVMAFNEPHNPDLCLRSIKGHSHDKDVKKNRLDKKDKNNKDVQLIHTEFYYKMNSLETITNTLKENLKANTNQFRVSVSFGYVFELQKEDDEGGFNTPDYKYEYVVFTAGNAKNHYLFDGKYIRKSDDINDLANMITEEKLIAYIALQQPSSAHKIIGIFSMKIKTFEMKHLIGTKVELPDYIKQNQNVINIISNNNMCFWNCSAYHETKQKKCATRGKEIFEEVMGKPTPKIYEGIDFFGEDIEKYEALKNVGVALYEAEFEKGETTKDNGRSSIAKKHVCPSMKLSLIRPTKISPIYNEKGETTNIMNILVYEDHALYITKLDTMMKCKFQCGTCGNSNFTCMYDLKKHIEICENFTKKDEFPKTAEVYETKRNFIIELNEEYGTNVDFRFEPIIVYDFESTCMEKKKSISKEGNLKINNIQTVVSVSLCSNIEGFNEEPFFFENREPAELLSQMFQQLDAMCEKAGDIMKERGRDLIEAIEAEINKEVVKEEEEAFKIKKKILIGKLNRLIRYLTEIPILGFNSGNYDINLCIEEFMNELRQRGDINSIKATNTFKCVKSGVFNFLDVRQYLPPNYNLDAYIKAFNKGGLKKSIFPYEFLDGYDKLNYDINILTKNDFYSKLKSSHISNEEWEEFEKNKVVYGWKTVKDLLKFYNNLDVKPFLDAVLNHRQFFYSVGLEMFKDGMSLPGLAEKIMFQFEFQDFNDRYIHEQIPEQEYTPFYISSQRLKNYSYQDQDTRRYNAKKFIKMNEVEDLFKKQSSRCFHCWENLTLETWTLDRINNNYGHETGNCLLSCLRCNTQRGDTKLTVFTRKKALLRYSQEHDLIHLIDEENKIVYEKLKNNICGGASIVFHRHHEAESFEIVNGEKVITNPATKIKRPVYNEKTQQWMIGKEGKEVKNITGFDANALYLWCIGNEMPCGILKYIENKGSDTKEAIDAYVEEFEKVYGKGSIEVDIYTPKHLYNQLGEYPLIFKNVEYDANEEAGEFMKDICDKFDNKKKRMTRKLISSFKGEKVIIKIERLKWLLEKGLIITKIYGCIPCKMGRPFKKFMEKVSEERRKGDIDPDHEIIAEMWKLVGNSAFGRTGMDKSKHTQTKYGGVKDYYKAIGSALFKDANQYGDLFECTSDKRTTMQNTPIQIACSIYDDAKFLMSKFHYDCIDKFIDRKDYQMIEMDTDSSYMALTGDFEELVKPEMRETFEEEKHLWFPRTDTVENKMYDRRKAGLFKVEFKGKGIVALASKMYYVKGFGEKNKYSSKGIQHRNNASVVNFENYKDVVYGKKLRVDVENKGMRMFSSNQVDGLKSDTKLNRNIYTYSQVKLGLSSKYNKRQVLFDCVSTIPLDI